MLITSDRFIKVISCKFKFLQELGFVRNIFFEENTSTVCSVVYTGQNVAFIFSLDIRDQCIDSEIVKIKDNKLFRSEDGGYSSDIYDYLVRFKGYRGSPSGIAKKEMMNNGSRLEQIIDGIVNLLTTAGKCLLTDTSDVFSS